MTSEEVERPKRSLDGPMEEQPQKKQRRHDGEQQAVGMEYDMAFNEQGKTAENTNRVEPLASRHEHKRLIRSSCLFVSQGQGTCAAGSEQATHLSARRVVAADGVRSLLMTLARRSCSRRAIRSPTSRCATPLFFSFGKGGDDVGPQYRHRHSR